MAGAKPQTKPQVKCCEEGRLEVELPPGEWSLYATSEHGKIVRQEPDDSPSLPPTYPPGSIYHTLSTEDTSAYFKQLRKVMCDVFDRADLKLISADIGLGRDFITDEKLEYECQRLIDECYRRGDLQRLLRVCREFRPRTFFPDQPVRGDNIELGVHADEIGTAVATIDPATVDPTALRRAMRSAYDRPAFEILCKELGLDIHDIRGETLETKMLYLIDSYQRWRKYAVLVRKVLADHPYLAHEL